MLTSPKNKNFIIQNFPPDYKKMTYVELSFGKGTLLLTKETSKEEFINDENAELTQDIRTIRDQSGYCIRSLKKINIDEKPEQPKSNIESVVNKLRVQIQKKADIPSVASNLQSLAKRLLDVYIINKQLMYVIKTFNSPETLLFVNSLNKKNQASLEQVNLADNINSFRGKVVLISYPSNFYNKSFKEWKCLKKTDICLWRNWK